jgi:hypothetical protein
MVMGRLCRKGETRARDLSGTGEREPDAAERDLTGVERRECDLAMTLTFLENTWSEEQLRDEPVDPRRITLIIRILRH